MNLAELTDHFRDEAQDAPEVSVLLAEIGRRADRRSVQRRRWSVLSAVAAVVVLVVVIGLIAQQVRPGQNLPSGPAAPSISSAGPTRPSTAGTDVFAPVTSVQFTEPPMPSVTVPAHSVVRSAAEGLVTLQLPDIVSPVTMPDPPAGMTRHTITSGPSALSEIWQPAKVDGADVPNADYGYIVSTADPIMVPGVSTTAPRSVPSQSVGPVSSTAALAQNAVVTRTTIAGRSFEVITVPESGFDLVGADVAKTRLAWQLTDGRWIQIFDRGRPATALAELAAQVTSLSHTLPRTVRVSLSVAGFTDVFTRETIGADSDGSMMALCPRGTVPGLEPSDSLNCVTVGAGPGTMSVLETVPAPVPSTLAGMSAQVDNGFAWYQVGGMSMSLQAGFTGLTRDQIMAVLASASYTPA